MLNAIGIALGGLQTAIRKVEESAVNIAAAPASQPLTGPGTLIEDIVDLKVGEHQFKANIVTLKISEDMSEELLRIFDDKV